MRTFLIATLVLAACGCSQPPPGPASPSALPSTSASPSGEAEGRESGRRRGFDPARLQRALGLTEEQMRELEPLFAEQRQSMEKAQKEFRDEMRAVLTDAQREKLRSLSPEERRGNPPWEQLDLTAEQANRLEELRQTHREAVRQSRDQFFEKLAARLTPEQKARLEEVRKRRPGRE